MIALFLGAPGANGWQISEQVVQRPAQAVREVRKLLLVGGTDVAQRELAAQVERIERRRAAVEPDQQLFTVAQFCAERGMKLVMADMQRLGRAAAKWCRAHGHEIGRTGDELFGEVNAYPVEALDAAQLEHD